MRTKLFFVISLSISLSVILTLSFPTLAQPKTPALKLGEPLPENLFVELAKAVNPAVVNISTTAKPRRQRGYNDPMLEFLERFYGPGFSLPQQQPQHSLGTGFVIREDGLIITNNHVIEGADEITVQFTEKEDKGIPAEVVGRDQRTDIALLKIKATKKLTIAPLGNSKDVQVGEWVAAFGNPYGHGHTMTKGIISALGREIGELNRFPFIQTDASINPGNSGGPLVNSKGYVIGVNSAIDARAQGIGFAIPIDEVKMVIADLEKTGRVRQGYIGVGLGELNPRAALNLGIDQQEGVIITQVVNDAPADKAGVKPYDVVQEFNGKKIKGAIDFSNAVASAPIGQKAKLKVLRENKSKELEVLITERPSDEKPKIFSSGSKEGTKSPMGLGMYLKNIDSKTVKDWGIPEDLTGLPIVIGIDAGSPAARSGLKPGDVIFDVNKKRVRSTKEAIGALKKGTNTLRIQREDNMGFIIIESE